MANMIPHMYLVFGGLFFGYFILLWIHCGRIPAFGRFWCVSGLVMTVLGLFTKDHSFVTPDGVTTVFYDENLTAIRNFCIDKVPLILIIAGILFLIGICILHNYGQKKPSIHGDYLIVLGAHVNGNVPSVALRSRIRAAYKYLSSHPKAKAVLTGGKGLGEWIAEAVCMKQELERMGIKGSRLLVEDLSTTTHSNILRAKKIICSHVKAETEGRLEEAEILAGTKIIVVTNDFHALRGVCLAKQAGFRRVEAIGTPSSLIMKPHYYTREVLSWIKFGIVFLIKKTGE